MALTTRSVMLRSLPVLMLTFVLAFFAAPVSSGQPAGPGVTSAAGAVSAPATAEDRAAAPVLEDPAPLGVPAGSPTPGAARVLRAQHTAGVSGSRAPPAGLI